MSVLTDDGWQTHWRRVNRGYQKLQQPYGNTELYDDDLYHYFQDAWHLKDWIKNDPVVPGVIAKQVETEISGNRILCITADFANGTKHMVLSSPRGPENAQLRERKVSVTLGIAGAPSRQERILHLADGSKIAAESVAHDVLNEWGMLLRKWGLIA